MTDYDADIAWDEELIPWDGIETYGSQENPFYFGLPKHMVTPPPRPSRAFQNFIYKDGKLELTFLTGKKYTYKVSEHLYRRFLAAESKGAFFHEHIRHLPVEHWPS